MKRCSVIPSFLLILALLLSRTAFAYEDHRGRNLDSLELTISHWTAETLLKASSDQRKAYCNTCRELAWGYLVVDGPRSMYYARRAIETARMNSDDDAIFDASILMGQCFWAKEQYDSARVYYFQAADALSRIEENWTDPDPHNLEAGKARLWGTLGNFYAAQDSLEQFAHYYGKAAEIFEKWGWYEDCATLYKNIGEFYTDNGDLKTARPAYEKSLEFARQSGDSLMIAGALYGLGRWYNESGQTIRALEYLQEADAYFLSHPEEAPTGHADTVAIMNSAHEQLYNNARIMARNARIIAIGAVVLLVLAIGIIVALLRLKRTRKVLSETTTVLDETIEEMRPADGAPVSEIHLTKREKDVAALLIKGRTTQEIAFFLGIGDETVIWYRKRLFAKLDVHSVAAFTSEMMKRGLP